MPSHYSPGQNRNICDDVPYISILRPKTQINLVYDLFINLSDAIENYENNQDSYETLMGTIVEEVNKLHRMEIAYVSTYR